MRFINKGPIKQCWKYSSLLVMLLLIVSGSSFAQKKNLEFNKVKIKSLSDTIVPYLANKIEAYTFMIDRNAFNLKMGYDLGPVQEVIPPIEKKLKAFKKKFEKTSSTLNLNSLNTMVILLNEVSKKLGTYKENLTDYSEKLTKSNAQIQRIINDPALQIKVPDSILTLQVSDLLVEGKSLNNLQKRTLATVNLWRSRISVSLLQANDLASDMQYLAINKKVNMWSPDEPPLFSIRPDQYKKGFFESGADGLSRTGLILRIFMGAKAQIITISLLIFIILTTWILSNMRRINRNPEKDKILSQVRYLKRNVIIGSLMAFSTYAPLLFGDPTVQVVHAFELLRLLTLTYLIYPFITKKGKFFWASFSILWIWYALDDLLIDSSFGERWILFVGGIAFVMLCLMMLISVKDLVSDLQQTPLLRVLVIFSLAIGLLSILLNLTGRLTLAKIFGECAMQSLFLGVSLIIVCRMVIEAIYLQTEAYKESRFSAFINFKQLQYRYRRNFFLLAGVVWVIGLARDLMIYDWLFKMGKDFFNQDRMIGHYNFSIGSVVIFFIVIIISSAISRFIKFFFDNEKVLSSGKRSSMNSMVLLFRLTIWILGFLIAVAIAGIPLDKLSLMLGALGVGIGFGLQNIVNNLVSGIILAFERPIQVGDQIEIGTKSGTVKEIGVRSSKLSNSEGADIIIPNGDLLSQQLINWTLQDRTKRSEFMIGVSYQSDLDKVFNLINGLLTTNKQVLQEPKPVIIIENFGDYSINIRIQFWIADLGQASIIRSEIMANTKHTLSEAGIQIQNRPVSGI